MCHYLKTSGLWSKYFDVKPHRRLLKRFSQSVIFVTWRQCVLPSIMCPPMRAHWRHLMNAIEVVLPSSIRDHNPNGKSIGSAIFAQLRTVSSDMSGHMSFLIIIAQRLWCPLRNGGFPLIQLGARMSGGTLPQWGPGQSPGSFAITSDFHNNFYEFSLAVT